MTGSEASARKTHALLHAARELRRHAVPPPVELHQRELLVGDPAPLLDVDLADLEAEGDVVADGAMGEQRHVLKHHSHLLGAHAPQLFMGLPVDVLAVDQNASGTRLDQPIDVTDERGLAAPRQPHDAEDLAVADGEVDIGDAHHALEPFEDLVLREPVAARGLEGLLALVAEDLPDMFADDGAFLLHGVSRSTNSSE